MRSHRVGAAHRAAIRRLAALEQQNRDLLERARRQGDRLAEPAAERERDLRARGALRGGVFQR